MANQQFLDALKEQDKVDFIKSLFTSTGGGTLTGAQIRALLDAVTDTNIFDDASKKAINDLVSATQGSAFTNGDPMNMDPDLTTTHTASSVPIVLTQPQILPITSIAAMASNTLISVGSTFKALHAFGMNTMTEKGDVSDVNDIVETGIYTGNDVANSPIQGHIMVMAHKDLHSNFNYLLMGSDMILHTGGKPLADNTPTWKTLVYDDVAFSYKGIITNMDEIIGTGIYEGADIIGAPTTGHVIIEAYANQHGDLDVSLKGQDGRRYEGGRPAGGVIHWHNVSPDHLFGTANPDNADGNDGDIYFKYH